MPAKGRGVNRIFSWLRGRPFLLWSGRLLGAGVPAAGATVAIRNTPEEWGWVVFVAAFSYGGVILQSVQLDKSRGDKAQLAMEPLLGALVRQLQKGTNARLRANVMLADRNGAQRIVYAYGMDGAPDLDLVLEKRQGTAGQAFIEGRFVATDLDQLRRRDINERWKLSPDQIEKTRGIKSLVSVPVRRQGDAKIIGTLNVDSSESLAQSLLDTEDAMLTMNEWAALVRKHM